MITRGLALILFSLFLVFGSAVHADYDPIASLMANVEGSEAVYQTVKSALIKVHSDLLEKLGTEFSEFEVLMAKYKTNDQSYTSYDKLSEDQIRELSTKLSTLSETMSKIANVL